MSAYHDHLYKELLRTCFAEFVELFFSAIGKYMERDSVDFLAQEVFSQTRRGVHGVVDLVAKARVQGAEAQFLIHVEQQSKAEAGFSERMLEYYALLRRRERLPVYPIALLTFDAPLRPEPSNIVDTFPDGLVLDFRFRVVQLNRLQWRDYLESDNPIASALMAAMRIAPEDRPLVKMECLRRAVQLTKDDTKRSVISSFVDACITLTASENRRFDEHVNRIRDPKTREAVMELTTSWERKGRRAGRREGREEGREEGRQEAIAEILNEYFARRSGPLPDDLNERIRSLSMRSLDSLTKTYLDFAAIDDLRRWLAEN